VRSAAGAWAAGTSGPTVSLDLTDHSEGTFELLRLMGSRRSAAQVDRHDWSGSWRELEDGIFHMPLPATDIIE
jgi:hypothetical protein